jgi:hypothetical protein
MEALFVFSQFSIIVRGILHLKFIPSLRLYIKIITNCLTGFTGFLIMVVLMIILYQKIYFILLDNE